MYFSIKTLFLSLLICGSFINVASGKQPEPHRGNLRAARHADVRPGSSHRHFRKTSRSSSSNYEDYMGHQNLEKISLPNQSTDNDWSNTTDTGVENRNSTSTNDLANGTSQDTGSAPETSPPGGTKNFTQQAEISQVNSTCSTDSYRQYSPVQNGTLNGTAEVPQNSSQSNYNSSVSSNATEALPASSNSDFSLPSNGMQKGGIFLGFLPDDGSSGGTRQTMAELNSDVRGKAAVYGWYAQAHSGTPFDGSQLLAVIDDVKACNCVFQPAVMPIGGWQGLTSSDNSQAVAIAQVMKKFTDEGIPVWLRFAHEMNYYQTDGTYQGTATDFKAGWAAVAAAVKQIAPAVKMWWTPNVSSAEDYQNYEPDDMSTVDLVGVDFYPKKLSGKDFLNEMQEFHDKYAIDGRKFAIGETGLGWSGTLDDKTKWFNEICEAKSSLPQFLSMAWFNFDKEYDYKIAGEPTLNQKFTALIAS